jgi:hypothetical protein
MLKRVYEKLKNRDAVVRAHWLHSIGASISNNDHNYRGSSKRDKHLRFVDVVFRRACLYGDDEVARHFLEEPYFSKYKVDVSEKRLFDWRDLRPGHEWDDLWHRAGFSKKPGIGSLISRVIDHGFRNILVLLTYGRPDYDKFFRLLELKEIDEQAHIEPEPIILPHLRFHDEMPELDDWSLSDREERRIPDYFEEYDDPRWHNDEEDGWSETQIYERIAEEDLENYLEREEHYLMEKELETFDDDEWEYMEPEFFEEDEEEEDNYSDDYYYERRAWDDQDRNDQESEEWALEERRREEKEEWERARELHYPFLDDDEFEEDDPLVEDDQWERLAHHYEEIYDHQMEELEDEMRWECAIENHFHYFCDEGMEEHVYFCLRFPYDPEIEDLTEEDIEKGLRLGFEPWDFYEYQELKDRLKYDEHFPFLDDDEIDTEGIELGEPQEED